MHNRDRGTVTVEREREDHNTERQGQSQQFIRISDGCEGVRLTMEEAAYLIDMLGATYDRMEEHDGEV